MKPTYKQHVGRALTQIGHEISRDYFRVRFNKQIRQSLWLAIGVGLIYGGVVWGAVTAEHEPSETPSSITQLTIPIITVLAGSVIFAGTIWKSAAAFNDGKMERNKIRRRITRLERHANLPPIEEEQGEDEE